MIGNTFTCPQDFNRNYFNSRLNKRNRFEIKFVLLQRKLFEIGLLKYISHKDFGLHTYRVVAKVEKSVKCSFCKSFLN